MTGVSADKFLREHFQEETGRALPTRWEVCPTCDGRAVLPLPGITFTFDDVAEDPDFARDYRDGVYDEPCPECRGRSTILAVDFAQLTREEEWIVDQWERDGAVTAAIRDHERRLGA